MGATGIVNALDADTGKVLWTRNAASDTGVQVPDWGFASSPLAIDDIVVIAVSGQLIAYQAATGNHRWTGPKGGAGHSSPHLATIHDVAQILLLRRSRTISVAPADGALLWEHTWQPGVGIVQPALVGDADVLITVAEAMGGVGIRRIAVSKEPSGWSVEERWTSRGLKPYVNDSASSGSRAPRHAWTCRWRDLFRASGVALPASGLAASGWLRFRVSGFALSPAGLGAARGG